MESQALICGDNSEDRSGSDHASAGTGTGGAGRRRNAYQVPSEEEILFKIDHLGGLVTMGLLAPKVASVLLACLREPLKYHQNRTSPAGASRIPDESLLEVARKNPEILAMIEPLLTEAQIDLLMKRKEGGGDG